MSTVTLKVQKTDSEFLKVAGNVVVDNDKRRWYYLPFWYEEVGDGLFVQHSFEDLPESLKNYIHNERISEPSNTQTGSADR